MFPGRGGQKKKENETSLRAVSKRRRTETRIVSPLFPTDQYKRVSLCGPTNAASRDRTRAQLPDETARGLFFVSIAGNARARKRRVDPRETHHQNVFFPATKKKKEKRNRRKTRVRREDPKRRVFFFRSRFRVDRRETFALRRHPSWNDMEHRRTIATSAGATVPAGLRPPARPSGFASRERGARTCRSDTQLDEASFRFERENAFFLAHARQMDRCRDV